MNQEYSIILDTEQKEITLAEFEKVLKELTEGTREEAYVNGEFIKDISEIGFYNFCVDFEKEFIDDLVNKLSKHHIKSIVMTDEQLETFWDERDEMRNAEETVEVIFKDKTIPVKLTPVSDEEYEE